MIALVAILAVSVLGIVFSLIGAVKLRLSERAGLSDAQFGGLISTLMFTSMIVVLAIGPLVDAWGHKPFAILGFLLSGAAIWLFAFLRSYKALVVGAMLLGVGGMCVNTVGNTLMPQVLFGGQNANAALNLGNMFFGLGAFLTPFLAGFLIQKIGYSKTITIVALVALVPVIFAVTTTTYPPQPPSGFDLNAALRSINGWSDAFVRLCDAAYYLTASFGLLANPMILAAALALFCYVGLEASMGGWISSYLTSIGLSEGKANTVLSGFWIGIMLARLITAGVVNAANGPTVLTALALVAAATIFLMVASKSKGMGAVAVLLTGLAFGPIFPTIVGVTFSKIVPELHGSAFAIIFAIGLLGASTIPAAIGLYARGKSIQKSLVIAGVTALLLFAVAIYMGRLAA